MHVASDVVRSLVVILGMIDSRLNPLEWSGDAATTEEGDDEDMDDTDGVSSGRGGGGRAPILDDPSFRDEDGACVCVAA